MTIRKKTDGLSFQQKVWKVLKDANRPMSYCDLERIMGAQWGRVRSAMRWMVPEGYVIAHGPPSHGRRFTAGPCMPPDLRGTGKSLLNLKHVNEPKGYGHRLDDGYKPLRGWRVTPKPTTALEEVWGWGVAVPTRVDKPAKDTRQYAGEVASAISEEAA